MYAALYVARDAVSLSLCHRRGSRTVHWIGQKLLDHRTSKACNLVKSGSFSLKFLRKPSLVLL